MALLVTPITIFLVPANKKFLTHTLFRNMLVIYSCTRKEEQGRKYKIKKKKDLDGRSRDFKNKCE